jgi:hypothetical protein
MRKLLTLSVGTAMCIVTGMLSVGAANAADAPPIEVTLQNDAFSPAEVKLPANTAVILKFINKDAAAAEIEAKDLNIEKVVVGNSEIIVRVRPLKPGKYLFVNEYKEDVTKGYVIVE